MPEAAEADRREEALRRLRARRQDLQAALEEMDRGELGESLKEALSEPSSYDNHPADLGTETWQRAQGLAFQTRFREVLAEVDAAAARVGEGAYGTCERCGRPIPTERLEVLPETRHCVTCSAAVAEGPRRYEVLPPGPPFGRSFNDATTRVGFDGEDAWQAVARYGTSNTPADVPNTAYPHVLIDARERHGAVQDVENLADAAGEAPPGSDPQ